MENDLFRERIAMLHDIFGKHNINAKEYAEYLDMGADTVCKRIRAGELPGQVIGSRDFLIPIASIAKMEMGL